MSIISKLPCRRFKLGSNTLPSISCSLVHEKRTERQIYDGSRSHFSILRDSKNGLSTQHLSKITISQAKKSLNNLNFRRGILGAPAFKEDRPEPKAEGAIL